MIVIVGWVATALSVPATGCANVMVVSGTASDARLSHGL
jgi:hypothetical protein